MPILLIVAFWTLSARPALACTTLSFRGTDLRTGAAFHLEPKGAKATVVVFLSSLCPCSRSHEPSLKKLAEDFADFQFLGVHSNKEEEGAREHFLKAGFRFPLIQDDAFKFANALGALKTPHAFVIGPENQCWFNGGIDSSQASLPESQPHLRNALIAIRKGEEPAEKVVRTLGCVIRR
jgi:thiol-disulfide isomerase/thioredoxin